jgi:predicted MPP superfamily phosphohydrolase
MDKLKRHIASTELVDAPLKVCLVHEPDTAQETHKYFDLQFSGHTHGGQCIAPFGIGPILAPSMGRKFIIGAYKVGNMIIHISSGIGISPLWKPLVRFNNIAEVSVIRVVSRPE